jgi:hypothetical protein
MREKSQRTIRNFDTAFSFRCRRNFEPKSTKQNSDSALVAAVAGQFVGGDEFAHGSVRVFTKKP